MPHTQCHQAEMKSVSFQRTASTHRPDDEIHRRWQRQPIWFDSFLQIFISSIRMRIFHFLFTFVRRSHFSIHLTNSLTTNSWQWNIPKYCSHLLVFAGKIRICKFDACRHIRHLSSSVWWLWHSRSVCTRTYSLTKTISENHFWISPNTDQKITCIFQYTFVRSFTRRNGSLYSYVRQKKREIKLEMICDILFYLEFFSLSTCALEILV